MPHLDRDTLGDGLAMDETVSGRAVERTWFGVEEEILRRAL
jgi:hypothetical protein